MPWVFSNYIQLHIINDIKHEKPYVDFFQAPALEICPWIYNQHLKRETVLNLKKDICEFFVECIDLNNYVYGVFEQSHFGRTKFSPHDTFIYGYNKDRKAVNVADFTFEGKYTYKEVSFSQIEKAYFAIDENNDWLLSRGRIQLFSFNAKASYDFKPSLVSEFLKEFLLSKNTFQKNTFNVDKTNKSTFAEV